jgi:GntR family carbon starvation induced transcriptional regulator
MISNVSNGLDVGSYRFQADPSASGVRSLIEAASQRLRADIVCGRLAAGARLGIEELKSHYGVSGGTVREALSLLVADGLVQAQAQRGFKVSPMSLRDVEDLASTRILLECEALRQSVEHGDADWQARVARSHQRLCRLDQLAASDPVRYFEEWEPCNRDFHQALISACPSTWIGRFLSILYLQMERYRRLTSMHSPPTRDVQAEHQALVDSALARDGDRCAELLRAHIESSTAVVRQFGLLR